MAMATVGNPCANVRGVLRMEEGRMRKATWSGEGGTITFSEWAAAARLRFTDQAI